MPRNEYDSHSARTGSPHNGRVEVFAAESMNVVVFCQVT